jgi:hypothetical protein
MTTARAPAGYRWRDRRMEADSSFALRSGPIMRNVSIRIFVSALLAASALSAAPARAEGTSGGLMQAQPPAETPKAAAPCHGAKQSHQHNVDHYKKDIALVERIIDELNAKAIKESQETSTLDDSKPADHDKIRLAKVHVLIIQDKINKYEDEIVTDKAALSTEQAALTESEGQSPCAR